MDVGLLVIVVCYVVEVSASS